MNNNTLADNFLDSLLSGNRLSCSQIIGNLTEEKMPVEDIYEKIIKKSLYKIGELWEKGKISVATEHLASAIVESVLNEMYSKIISQRRVNKSIVVSAVENEMHQIGSKMVADIFEMQGWNAYFLGASTPAKDLTSFIKDVRPDLVALSMSISVHFPALENTIDEIRKCCQDITILVGGQGLRPEGRKIMMMHPNVLYLKDLYNLKSFIININ